MKLVVFGANGRVGREVVKQAIERGHQVKAVVRDSATFEANALNPEVERVSGVTMWETQRAVRGADAVVSALGPRDVNTPIIEGFIRVISEAMTREGVPRLVVVSVAGLTPLPDGKLRGDVQLPAFLRTVYADHRAAMNVLKASKLDWTLVCPPNLPDGPKTEKYRSVVEGFPDGGREIASGDVAHAVLEALGRTDLGSKRVGIAY